jgi:hypothetical protein
VSRFNPYLTTHFQGNGCRLIARAHDDCRARDVRLYAIPGYWDCVGVTDGTDAWIAPASSGLFFRTATGDCADLLRRLQAGDELPPVPDFPKSAAPRKRVRLETDSPSAAEQQTPQRRERVRL